MITYKGEGVVRGHCNLSLLPESGINLKIKDRSERQKCLFEIF